MSRSVAAERIRARQRELARVRERLRRRRRIVAGAAVGGVLAIIAVMVIVRVSTPRTVPVASADAAVVVSAALATVPSTTLDQVKRGQTAGLPTMLSDQPPLLDGGRPLVLYVGAEYCPFCAAQRWGLVVALNRFGTFTGLGVTHSGLDDVFPGTSTVSFFGASYTSSLLAFAGVELAGNERRGGNYAPLQALTPAQAAVLGVYDAPPFVPASSQGAVPFVDFGNHLIMSGSAFSPGLLAGLTHEQIAAALADPASPVAQAVLGSANAFTAALCDLTAGQPAAVCDGTAAHAYPELTRARG